MMSQIEEKIKLIEEEIKIIFSSSNSSHDLNHTHRVLNNALHIAKTENANIDIIKVSCLLHDIAREHQDRSGGLIDHAELGAELSEKILENLDFEKKFIDEVKHCIETHRFRNEKEPKTIEAKILFDADKLDSIGAIGIGRAFVFSGESGAKVHSELSDESLIKQSEYSEDDTAYREFLVKLSKIKDKMLTKEGKKLAEERHQFMTEFFEKLKSEIKGES